MTTPTCYTRNEHGTHERVSQRPMNNYPCFAGIAATRSPRYARRERHGALFCSACLYLRRMTRRSMLRYRKETGTLPMIKRYGLEPVTHFREG